MSNQHIDTVVIGAGQAGLAMGYYLTQQRREFVILDAAQRIGESWRNRWDSLRLFTPASHSALPGLPWPTPGRYFPTKDETADCLEAYARRFNLPLALGQHADALSRHDHGYLVTAAELSCDRLLRLRLGDGQVIRFAASDSRSASEARTAARTSGEPSPDCPPSARVHDAAPSKVGVVFCSVGAAGSAVGVGGSEGRAAGPW